MTHKPVRVRFAPSPTGALHIGGVRTALYNFLFARQHKGTFILRIEDTDQNRFVPGAEAYIFEALRWLGLSPDESPEIGGPFQPYRQSERKTLYRQYAEQMVAEDKAYYAFDTEAELEALREKLKAAKAKNISYNAITRLQMKNSLTLPPAEVKARIDNGEPYVIRIKIPPKDEIRFQDLVMGWVKAHSSTLDDKVLLKPDGLPTYHLANVVDDYLMQISHVIRGKEWLPSAYLHVLLYDFLGWSEARPEFAHLPLLLRPDGKGKLSKRDGLRLGMPIFPLAWQESSEEGELQNLQGFREDGFLPEAVLNFLVFLGWNPGTEQEMFSMDELIEVFDLSRVVKSDAVFDFEKAKWFNQQYLKQASDAQLATALAEVLKIEGLPPSTPEKMAQIAALMKERITFPKDILREADYFFHAPATFEEKIAQKRWSTEGAAFVQLLHDELLASEVLPWETEALHEALHQHIESQQLKMGKVMPALRLALTGQAGGPDLMGIMVVLGREETRRRLAFALQQLGNGK
ncbi:MAG: glutamate--tRNA ligase [Microscillaceae bacterium]